MSQAGRYFEGSGPADLETLTGNTGGAVSPDGANNINVVGYEPSGITVVGNPGTNTLTIYNNQASVATVTTTDATPTALITTTLTTNSVITIDALVTGAKDDYSSGIGGRITGVARRAGGGAVLIGTPQINYVTEDAGGLLVVVSGNDIIVQVIGEAATTYNWSGYVQFITYPT